MIMLVAKSKAQPREHFGISEQYTRGTRKQWVDGLKLSTSER